MRSVLWPKRRPPTGETVRVNLQKLLAQRFAAAVSEDPASGHATFLLNALEVADRYDRGLYVCYDDLAVPKTTNDLEGQHGASKHHERKTTGRSSTSAGPIETAGEFVLPALDMIKRKGAQAAVADLHTVDPVAYAKAREDFKKASQPARRYRAFQRNPIKVLADVVSRWKNKLLG